MRVGLSTTTIEPSFTNGHFDGIGVYTSALLQNLPGAGCRVEGFYYPSLRNIAASPQPSVGTEMRRSFVECSMRDLLLICPSSNSLPIDLFHSTDYRIVRMDCPVVATLHDAIPLKYPEWCNPRMRGLKNWLQKKATRKADHVIALSRFAVRELVECFGIDEQKVTVVPCGVSPEWQLAPSPDDVKQTLDDCGLRRGYFLFVGTLQPRKNVARIVDAYLALPANVRKERQLVIVGRAGSRCKDVIDKIRAAVQHGENIVWLNSLVGQRKLRHVYDAAAVFVFPSLYEGFGIPVTEAFASGVPVLTSNTTSLPEVSQGAALEINPLSTIEISDAMLSLINDEALRTECIKAGHERVAELTWQRTAQETAAVYKAVLGR